MQKNYGQLLPIKKKPLGIISCYKLNYTQQNLIYMKKMSPANIGFELMDRVNKCLGILSLSRTFTNLLMWSHYANNHTGFVIGLMIPMSFSTKKPTKD